MRYLAVAVLAALYWVSVATLRQLGDMLPEPPARPVATSAVPAARIDSAVPHLSTIEQFPEPSSPLPVIRRPPPLPPTFIHVSGRTQAAYDRVWPDLLVMIDWCRPTDDPSTVYQVEAVVLANGRVSSAKAKGRRVGKMTARCVEEAFRTLRFPPAPADVTVVDRVRLYQRVTILM